MLDLVGRIFHCDAAIVEMLDIIDQSRHASKEEYKRQQYTEEPTLRIIGLMLATTAFSAFE